MNPPVKLIVVGGSAGGVQAVLKIFEHVQKNYSIPILLALHRHNSFPSPIEELLRLRTRFIAREIEEKDKIEPGYIYICPADYHVLIEKDHSFSLDASEKVNFSRPSIDVTFKSASDVFKEKLVCILLSGANADGADGLKHAQKRGSIIIIQDPSDAQVPYMPQEAIKRVKANHIMTTNEITGFLNSLVV